MVELKDESGVNHPIVLSEGVALTTTLDPNEPKYYRINLDDENVVKLTIQLTSIHGDPDMFVSTESKKPSKHDF